MQQPKFDMPTVDEELYVNDGESFDSGNFYPEDGEDRQQAKEAENESLAGSLPIVQANARWFAEAVNACDNIDNIMTRKITVNGEEYGRTVSIEAQVLAYQLLKAKLIEKAKEYESFMEDQV